MKYIIDSSAWIEYLEGSEKGEKVSNILKKENEIFILPLNIGEVVSKVKRKDKNVEIAYRVLISRSNIIEITPKIAKESGLLHAKLRQKGSSISLADTMIIKTAQYLKTKIITTDNHFKDFKEAIIL